MRDSNWLIRDGMDRERMLDMDRRIGPARRASFAVLAVALIACGPWLGWWTLAPLPLSGVLFSRAEKALPSRFSNRGIAAGAQPCGARHRRDRAHAAVARDR
jgi:hypothetical protein